MFQTPTEKFTPSLLRHFLLILLVSNSNGEIYTVRFSEVCDGIYLFQTLTEKFTRRLPKLEHLHWGFKLQRRNLHSLALSLSLDQYLVSNSNGEIYTVSAEKTEIEQSSFKLQRRNLHSGLTPVVVPHLSPGFKLQRRNLHSVRNSIFSGYEYWSLYSYPLNLDKQQRQFRIKHRICGVLQILAKTLSTYLQNFNQNR